MRAVLTRTVVLSALWWVLLEGRSDYLAYGLIAVPLAVVVSLRLLPASPPQSSVVSRAVGSVRLIGWAVWQAARGGLDVSRRALARRVDIDPLEVEVDLRLPPGHARGLAIGLMGLLPGALVQHEGEHRAVVHSLSPDFATTRQFASLEQHVSDATGVPLRADSPEAQSRGTAT